MTRGVTIKEIAKISGYSPSTISKALNDSPEISSITKEKVIKIANSLNYKPNFLASALRSNKSLILGVILPDLTDSFFLDSLNGITEESSKNDYKIMVYQSCNNYQKEVANTKFLSESNIIDGFIFSSTKETLISKTDEHINTIIKKGFPIVYIEKGNTYNFASHNSTKTSEENGFEIGQNCVKKLLRKIKNKQVNLSA